MKAPIVPLGLLALASCAATACADTPALSREFQDYMLAHHYVAAALESTAPHAQGLRASINGKSVVLTVDTGSPRTIICRRIADDLGLDVHDSGHLAGGIGGEMDADYGVASIKSFSLGVGDINRTNTILVDPKAAQFERFTDGLFGLDLLCLNAAILPIGGTGILLKPGPLAPVPIADYMTRLGFKALPLALRHGRLCIDGHIDGRPMHFLVDSGAPLSSFKLSSIESALGRQLHLTKLTFWGVDGNSQMTFDFTPASMDIGGFTIPPQILLASQAPVFDKSDFDGLIGVDILATRRAVIDLGGMTLWLK